jgi:hypothetical protein
MNDFSNIEEQLRKLRPTQPSSGLMARVERALAGESSPSTAGVFRSQPKFQLNWLSLGLGLAATAVILIFARLQMERPQQKRPNLASVTPRSEYSPANSNAQLVPAGLTQVVYHTSDEGLQFPNNSQEPMRRVRSHTRETLQWRNPKTGATLRISYPSEQVSLVPVTGQ